MKVIFCLDHKPSYLLLKAAVRSLRAVPPDADCLCVYAGADPALQATLAAENIPVVRHRPRITPGGLSPSQTTLCEPARQPLRLRTPRLAGLPAPGRTRPGPKL